MAFGRGPFGTVVFTLEPPIVYTAAAMTRRLRIWIASLLILWLPLAGTLASAAPDGFHAHAAASPDYGSLDSNHPDGCDQESAPASLLCNDCLLCHSGGFLHSDVLTLGAVPPTEHRADRTMPRPRGFIPSPPKRPPLA